MSLFVNGKIFTSKKGDDGLYQSMLVHNGKVLYVGDEQGASKAAQDYGLQVNRVDLGGKVMLPAFLDGHTHLVITGMGFTKLDVRGMSLAELQVALPIFRDANPNAKVLLCKGFRPNELDVEADRKYLDEIIPDIPLFIDTSSIHGCWVNSAGLKAIGVDESTGCPEGGEIVKDKDGRLTGFLHETAFHNIVWPYLGRTLDIEDRVMAIERMCQAYLAAGTVGAVEMALFPEDLTALEECYRRNGGRLPIRLACHWLVSPDGTEEDRLNRVREAVGHKMRLKAMEPWLKVVGIKILGDGIVDTCTAFLSKPYADGSTPGPIWPPSKLFPVVDLADSLDLQIAIHAIGDAAVDNALDAFEHALNTNGPKADRRNRIEHLEMVTTASIKRLTRLGVIASLQPTHADPAGLDNYREMLGGDERVDRLWPTTEYIDEGSHVAFGSDPPSAPYPALPNIYSATTRKSLTKPHHCTRHDARVLALEKYKIPLETSIRFYSLGTAYSTRDEQTFGSLEPGKQADFCILNIDPFEDGVMGLREAQDSVAETWMAGERVWGADYTSSCKLAVYHDCERSTKPSTAPDLSYLPSTSNTIKMMSNTDSTSQDGVPPALRAGTPMQKISSKKIKQVVMKINKGCISWAGSSDSKIPIDQIRELRLGQPPTDNVNASRWITVVYVRSSQWKVLHMIALTDDMYTLWVDTLSRLVSETSDRMVGHGTPSDPDTAWIRQLWPAGAKNIDWGVAVGLCRSIGLAVPQEKDLTAGPLDLERFRALVQDLQTRPDLEMLYQRMASKGTLDRTRVESFLTNTQGLQPDGLFDKYAQDGIWNLESLARFLSSSDNSQLVEMDMTRPLTEYYISSSHNTYLVGEQWRGESTVEGYIRVLLANCRCVEIDIHDGDVEPVAYHRVTLTSSVSVRSICKAIKKYAFITSPYPIIISAETRCGLEQQVMLAAIMREELGSALITDKLDDRASLPSPEELKYRILFKTKPPEFKIIPASAPSLSPRNSAFSFDSNATDSTTSESDSGIARLARRLSIGSNNSSNDKKSPKPPTFAQELSDLLVYAHGVKYSGFSKLIIYEPRHQFSVSEKTGAKLIKENKQDWIKHNFNHISRVYPKGLRLQSTNYDPVAFWSAGCQLVAVNWQTVDEGAILNHAMFVDTNGYVLKPLSLRQKVVEVPTRYSISISIISAQRLPLSSNLRVEVTLNQKTQTTKSIEGVTLSPTWNESFKYEITCTPSMLDLTFLHIEIKHPKSKGSMLAQWVRTLGVAPRGYHYLPLYDSLFSKYVFATIFVNITIDVIS